MPKCTNCQQHIVSGGVKVGDQHFCSTSCKEHKAKNTQDKFCKACGVVTSHVAEPVPHVMTNFRFQRFLGVLFAGALLGILALFKVEISKGVFLVIVVPIVVGWGILAESIWGRKTVERCEKCHTESS